MKTALLPLFLLFVLSACTGRVTKENILNAPLGGEVMTLDPAKAIDRYSVHLLSQSYEPLYEYHYLIRPYTLKPHLAADLPQISNDGKHYVFKISQGIPYHPGPWIKGPGRFVTAQDFITQIKRIAYKGSGGEMWWLFDGKVVGLNEFREKAGTDWHNIGSLDVAGLSAPNDHTLIIDLLKPIPQFIYHLAMIQAVPIPWEAVVYYSNDLTKADIGTGPFVLKHPLVKGIYELDRFKDYRSTTYPKDGDRFAYDWGLLQDAGKRIPFLDGLRFHVFLNEAESWKNLLAGKIGFLSLSGEMLKTHQSLPDLKKELEKKSLRLQMFPTLTYYWLAFNMKDPVLGKNRNLRMAIAHAINFENFINLCTQYTGMQANSLFPPGIDGHHPSHKFPWSYNPEKAKHFLALAGYPAGRKLPSITYTTKDGSETQRSIAEFIKASLEKIGFTVTIDWCENREAFNRRLHSNKLQIWEGGWLLDYPDPENVLQLLYSKNHLPGPNKWLWSNENFDRLFLEFRNLSPLDRKRQPLLSKMEEIVERDVPWILLYYDRSFMIRHNSLKNYRYTDLFNNYYKYLRIEGQ
jgi:ABC-type transport system substrate-binding protein